MVSCTTTLFVKMSFEEVLLTVMMMYVCVYVCN